MTTFRNEIENYSLGKIYIINKRLPYNKIPYVTFINLEKEIFNCYRGSQSVNDHITV